MVVRMGTTVAALAAAGLVAWAGGACGGDEAKPPPGGGAAAPSADVPARGDMLVVAYQADADVLMPIVEQSVYSSDISSLMFPLIYRDQFQGGLQYQPRVAERWEWDLSHTELTLHLRRDVKWSDGRPLTADDYLFTADLIRDPKVASPRLSHIEKIPPDGIRKVDDHTVKVRFSHPYDETTMMAHASMVALVPKHGYDGADRSTLRGHPLTRQPLTTGPFRLAKWEKDQELVLEANPDVTEVSPPWLRRVVFKIIPEYTTRLVELENGSVDMVQRLEVEDYHRLKDSHPELKFYRRGYRFLEYVGWNSKDPRFADPRVRRALTMAIDVDQIIQALLSAGGETFGRPAIGTITPELKLAFNDQVQRLPYDLEKAKALLAEAGWRDTDGDGVLDKGGKPFKFRLDTNTGNPRRAKTVVLVQDQLKKVGVQAEIGTIDSNTFFENLRLKKYEAAVAGWSAALFTDMSPMWHCDTPDKKYEFNFTSYCDPETDRLIDAALREPDPAKGGEIWKQVQARIYEAQPYTFLYWRDDIDAVHKRFRNVQADILSSFHNLHEWYVPDGEQKYRM